MSIAPEVPPEDVGNAFDAIRWAVDLPHITDGRGATDLHLRLVGFVLARWANGRTGRDCFPSIATIMDGTGLPDSTVRDVLRRGQQHGLWVSEGVNGRGVECWRLCLDADLTHLGTAQERAKARKKRNADRKKEYRRKQRLTGTGGTTQMSHGIDEDNGSNSRSASMSHGSVQLCIGIGIFGFVLAIVDSTRNHPVVWKVGAAAAATALVYHQAKKVMKDD